MENFSQIYLAAEEKAALRAIAAGPSPRSKTDAGVLRRLKDLGFVRVTFEPGGDDVVRITEPGRSFLIFDRERRKQFFRLSTFQVIDAVVTIASFIIACYAAFFK